jgi:Tfp pilus assembly protein PilW
MLPQHETGETIMDLLIALLQSMVVLLLASGVYIALVARKDRD